MATLEFRFDSSQQLVPALPDQPSRTVPVQLAASISVVAGQALARKTTGGKFYGLNRAATDGTQIFAGFAQMSGTTDSAGLFWPVFNGSTGQTTFYGLAQSYTNMWVQGVFDPNQLITAAAGTPVAEIDTVTIGGTVAIGDYYQVQANNGTGILYQANSTSGSTTTTQICQQWNSNPILFALAVASASSNVSTFTAVTPGQPLLLSVGKNSSAGTITLAIATPATVGSAGEVDTFTLSTSPSIGDTFLLTATLPNNTIAIATFVATAATVANVTLGLATAWNNSFGTSALANATSTSTTVVLTGVYPNQILSVAFSQTVGSSTTAAKVVTSAATGYSIADILPGNPAAHVIQPYGYLSLP